MTESGTGVLVGHYTDAAAKTGCTVVVLPEGAVASGEVRGGAPATRDFALLDPQRTVQHVDAVVMAGGSVFGLASSDGVVRALERDNRGFTTSAGPVPIVVGMGIFDLAVGDASVRPTAENGAAAYATASADYAVGGVGAGAGATIGNWRGKEHARPGGFCAATVQVDELVVTALLTVNSLGEIADGSIERVLADGTMQWPDNDSRVNTTVGVVVTNAVLSKVECFRVAVGGHDGMARGLSPAHTAMDGDALVAAATGRVEANAARVQMMAASAVEKAIRSLETG